MLCVLPLLMAYLGIDVAKAKLDVVLLKGEQTFKGGFANTPAGFAQLLAWLKQRGVEQVYPCLEATGSYSDAIVHFLYQAGFAVSLLNPAVLVDYRKSQNVRRKNDQVDALLLAHYAAEHHPRPWVPLPASVLYLRQLLHYRDSLLQASLQTRNRLLAGRLTGWVRDQVQAHFQHLERERAQAEVQRVRYLHQCADLKCAWLLLQTIPGIGWLASAYLLAHIGEIARFGSPKALVSLAGLSVIDHTSGSSVARRAHIDRHGREQLRQILYLCALQALRTSAQPSAMQVWAQRLQQRGKPDKVVMGAVMRKTLHIVYGVLKHQQPYDPTLTFGPLAA